MPDALPTSPAFLIRDDVLYVPAWEWDTSAPTICGHPFIAYLDGPASTPLTARAFGVVPIASAWVTLMFANRWSVNWSWAGSFGARCAAWLHQNGNPQYRPVVHRDQTPDDLLRLIRDAADRPAWAPRA